jgi:hypothetical protein
MPISGKIMPDIGIDQGVENGVESASGLMLACEATFAIPHLHEALFPCVITF